MTALTAPRAEPSPGASPSEANPPASSAPAYAELFAMAELAVPYVIRLVCDLKIADLIEDGVDTIDDLATELGADPDMLRRCMDLLVAADILDNPTPTTLGLGRLGALLSSRHKSSVQAAFPLMPFDIAGWARTDDAVRTGQPGFLLANGRLFYDHYADHLEDSKRFDGSVAMLHELIVRTMLASYRWDDIGTLVDVGGGNGLFVYDLMGRATGMHTTIVDREHVLAGAREALPVELEDRVDFYIADMFDDIPAGADAYLVCRVLHDWPDDKAADLLRRIREAMTPTSRVLILESLAESGNAYDVGKLMDIKQLVLFGGRHRTERELLKMLAVADLELKETITTPTMTIIDARVRGASA